LVLSNLGNCILDVLCRLLGVWAIFGSHKDIGNCNTPFNCSDIRIYHCYLDQYHIGVLFLHITHDPFHDAINTAVFSRNLLEFNSNIVPFRLSKSAVVRRRPISDIYAAVRIIIVRRVEMKFFANWNSVGREKMLK